MDFLEDSIQVQVVAAAHFARNRGFSRKEMPDHHPPHLYLDDTWYSITAAVIEHARLLASDLAKALVRDAIRMQVLKSDVTLLAWVVLDNHYHLLLRTKRGQDLPRLIGQLHGGTSRQMNLRDATRGRQFWHNYWDSCIRGDTDLWSHFN